MNNPKVPLKDPAARAAYDSLLKALGVWRELDPATIGSAEVQPNAFGEIALKIDIASEQAIIKSLKKSGVAARFVTEEHGEFTIGDNPQLLVVIDGLDGSGVYRDSRGQGRCGTLLAVYRGSQPRFKEYVFSGILEQGQGMLYVCEKTSGAYAVDLAAGTAVKINTSGQTSLELAVIYIDEGIQNYSTYPHKNGYFYQPVKDNFQTRYLKSSVPYYVDMVCGQADLTLELGRKLSFEHATAYPLIKESGGVMVFYPSGKDIGDTRYDDYVKINRSHPEVVMASTDALAREAIEYMKARDGL